MARAAGGVGLGGLTFLVLLVLRLTGLAEVSWFWVFFPLWAVPAAVFALTLAVFIIIGLRVCARGVWR